MGLSIIVPTTRVGLLKKLLHSVVQAKPDPDALQVIIVFDGARENRLALQSLVREFAPQMRISYEITAGFQGANKARNLGRQNAEFKQLLFLDDDTHLAPDFFSNLFKQQLPMKGVYLAKVNHCPSLFQNPEALYLRATWMNLPDKLDAYANHELIHWRMLQTCCLFIHSDIFDEVEGFDENYCKAHYDDMEFARRLARRGYQFRLLTDCEVYHFNYKSIPDYLKWSYSNGHWKKVFSQDFPEISEEIQLVTRHGLKANLAEVELISVEDKKRRMNVLEERFASLDQRFIAPFSQSLITLGLAFEAEGYKSVG